VDLTYRTDLREQNSLPRAERGEQNFARFDAKLEQRLAELRGELLTEIQRLRADMVRWMFGFWVTTVLMLGGLMVALRGP
jgi:hypothetical protein